MKSWIGIDPGTVGGWAYIMEDGAYACGDLSAADMTDLIIMLDDRGNHGNCIALCVLERGQAMPKQGVSSTFKYAHACGMIEGILTAMEIPYQTVRPFDWMKGMVQRQHGKLGSLVAARAKFPRASLARVKDSHRADALLLADWARRQG